jgi:hypothetical protein
MVALQSVHFLNAHVMPCCAGCWPRSIGAGTPLVPSFDTELDTQLLGAREQIAVADAAAAGGVGRLLTADGDELDTAGQAVLEALASTSRTWTRSTWKAIAG